MWKRRQSSEHINIYRYGWFRTLDRENKNIFIHNLHHVKLLISLIYRENHRDLMYVPLIVMIVKWKEKIRHVLSFDFLSGLTTKSYRMDTDEMCFKSDFLYALHVKNEKLNWSLRLRERRNLFRYPWNTRNFRRSKKLDSKIHTSKCTLMT